MDIGYLRLEREVAKLERELHRLKLVRYQDRPSSDRYFQVKALWARRQATLAARRPPLALRKAG